MNHAYQAMLRPIELNCVPVPVQGLKGCKVCANIEALALDALDQQF